jgi:hypothetical protein
VRDSQVILEIGSTALGCVFALAGFLKLKESGTSARAASGLFAVSESNGERLARLATALDFALASLLITGAGGQTVLPMVAAILVVFVALHAVLWRRGFDAGCGCFGDEERGKFASMIGLTRTAMLALITCGMLLLQLLGDAVMRPLWNRPISTIAIGALCFGVMTLLHSLLVGSAKLLWTFEIGNGI